MAAAARIAVILVAVLASTVLVTLCYIAVVAFVHGHPELMTESYQNHASWRAFGTALAAMSKTVLIPALVIVGYAEFRQKRGLTFYLTGGLLAGLAIYAVVIPHTDFSLNFQTAYGAVHMLILGMIWGIAYWLLAGRAAGFAR